MDNSTEGVTLFALFPLGILQIYEGKPEIHNELVTFMDGEDLSDPFNKVSMEKYNQMCDWIEDNLGKANAKIAGKKVGEAAFQSMIENKLITAGSSPIEVMKGLKEVASQMIQDPKNRGWEIVENSKDSILMRRTQSFNSSLQFGVLEGLLYKCKGIFSPHVKLVKEVEKGDEFDEYLLSWRS